MWKILLSVIILLQLSTNAVSLSPTDTNSGNAYLPHLKEVLTDRTNADPFSIGLYLGFTKGLSVANALHVVCAPPTASNDQVLRVIVHYLESHPERTHEDISVLALAALREAWPCSKR